MQTIERIVRVVPPLLAPDSALFLDFDGTLAAIAERPDQVQLAPTVVPILQALQQQLQLPVAIISGRALAEVDHYLRPLRLPGAGQHGGELRRSPDTPISRRRSPAVAAVAAELQAQFGNEPALLIEDKGMAVALHFREAPVRAGACIAAVEQAAQRHDLAMLLGKMVAEARPKGQDKGAAIAALMAERPFAGRVPVFIGDDRTDEDGFEQVQQRGGYGVRVGVGLSCAQYRLPDVAAVHQWLAAAIDAHRAGHAP